jgi:hypothetical protein
MGVTESNDPGTGAGQAKKVIGNQNPGAGPLAEGRDET